MMKGRLIPPSQKAFLYQQKDTADRLPNRTELSTQWIMRPPWIEARLRKEGNPIEAEDSMIAATAHNHGLTLVTGNMKHFARVKGLRVVDWEENPPKG
jgi:predicted nucleic acid-binding protein